VLAPWFAEIHAAEFEPAGLIDGVRRVVGMLIG
jgi:hypothetical protein